MFSKYDVYTTVQSMYCYPDTDVLINKLNIHDKAELKQAEEEFTAVKQNIAEAMDKAGRSDTVRIMAVTKTVLRKDKLCRKSWHRPAG